jgi:seryl-tRNA synthetase
MTQLSTPTEPSASAGDASTAEPGPATAPPNGLAVLDAAQLAVLRALDALLLRAAEACGATEVGFAPLSALRGLERIDYFRNFPHLGLAVAPLREDTVRALADGQPAALAAAPMSMAAPRYFLASAACYPVYAGLQDAVLGGPQRVTTVQHCFRNEQHYQGLARLLAFRMREIVFVGDRATVLEALADRKRWIARLAQALGLALQVEVASDPFFEPAGARARMQRLFPVKEEFVFGDSMAVSSVNFHRNFFGERWNIRTADGQHAFSGCVAFGLERWLCALSQRHAGDHDAILQALQCAAVDA